MICRHSPDDPECSSYDGRRSSSHAYRTSYSEPSYDNTWRATFPAPVAPTPAPPATPDADNYTIEESERVGEHLVLKVRYPNCKKCSYEGNKTLVYLNVTEAQALKWKKIDPHFRAPGVLFPKEAPSPAARFPASQEGWEDALAYARSKMVITSRFDRDVEK